LGANFGTVARYPAKPETGSGLRNGVMIGNSGPSHTAHTRLDHANYFKDLGIEESRAYYGPVAVGLIR